MRLHVHIVIKECDVKDSPRRVRHPVRDHAADIEGGPSLVRTPADTQARAAHRNEMANHVAQEREEQRSAALCGGKFQGTVIDVDLCPCQTCTAFLQQCLKAFANGAEREGG